jgi:hypothetical protein
MSTFLTGKNNDLVINGGQIGLVTDLEATLQLSKHYAQTLYGEMIHAMTDGVRMFDTAFNKPRLALFRNELRKRIMQVPDVISVTDIDVRISGENLVYSVTINTTYGVGVIDNG